MTRFARLAWLVPVAVAVLFWWVPPDGDDIYYHSVWSVEHVRAWQEGSAFPRHYRAWNGGTGSFLPSVYAPFPLYLQGVTTWATGDGLRGVGLTLALALAIAGALTVAASGRPAMSAIMVSPYALALLLTRATTSEALALGGIAATLCLAMPPGVDARRRGLALAASVVVVVGSQVGSILQVVWVLAAAWVAHLALSARAGGAKAVRRVLVSACRTVAWAASGLAAAAVVWLPSLLDGPGMALVDAVSGPYDWRRNFLPGSSGLPLFLTGVAVALAVVILLVAIRGEGRDRWPVVAAATLGLCLTVAVSAPLWHLPGMRFLQFPWRFLGPTTVLALIGLASLSGRWRVVGFTILLVPSVLVPLRIAPAADGVPVAAAPAELARIAGERWRLLPILPSSRGTYAPGFDRLESLQRLARQPAEVVVLERGPTGGLWQVSTSQPMTIMLPLQWWPEWRLSVGDQPVSYGNRHGLVAVEHAGGTLRVRAELGPSRARAASRLVSLFGLVLVAIMVAATGRRRPSSEAAGEPS